MQNPDCGKKGVNEAKKWKQLRVHQQMNGQTKCGTYSQWNNIQY